MTRDEELQNQAMCLIGFSREVSREDAIKLAYYFGAKYADATMLDKVCKWLKENIDLYAYNSFSGKSGYTEITLTDTFEAAFKKAMKE